MSTGDEGDERWLRSHLDPLGVAYELFPCDPALAMRIPSALYARASSSIRARTPS